MAEIEWTKELSIGFSEIDDDHKWLIAIYNDLDLSVTSKRNHEVIEEVLAELISYTFWHFSHEEKIMEAYEYPELDAHRLEHRELTDHAMDIQELYVQGDESVATILVPFLRNWLTNHLLGTDKKLGQFLAESTPSPQQCQK